jgi:hypothetical protein
MAAIHTAIRNVSQKIGTLSRDQPVFTDSGRVYNVIGIDQIHAALQPLLVEEGITVIPNVTEFRSWDVGESPNRVHFAQVRVEFTLTGSDGTSIVGSSAGEGSSDTDKALPAAISLAEKSFWKQILLLKTNDIDPDASGVGLSGTNPKRDAAPAARTASAAVAATNTASPNAEPAAPASGIDQLTAMSEPPPAPVPQTQPALENAVQRQQPTGEAVSEKQAQLISVILTGKKNPDFPNNQGMTQGQAYDFVEGVVGRALDRSVHYTKKFLELTKDEAKKVMDAIKQIPGVSLPDRPRQ